MMKSSASPKKVSNLIVLLICALCVMVLSIIDYYVEPNFSMIIFYLFPVSLATWLGGKKEGIAISVISAAGFIVSDIVSTEKYTFPIIPYWNVFATFIVLLIVSLVLSKLKKTVNLASGLARTDPLTGAANRKAFFEIAGIELYRVNRYKRPFTIAYLDIDEFKQVNETMGHEAGDELLRCVASVLDANVRSSDLLARLGGDEFALLLTETNEDQAKSVIEKLGNSLQEALKKGNWEITYSIGVVTYIRPPSTVDDMLKKADHMMYAAKREGKNRVQYLVWRESAIVK